MSEEEKKADSDRRQDRGLDQPESRMAEPAQVNAIFRVYSSPSSVFFDVRIILIFDRSLFFPHIFLFRGPYGLFKANDRH